MTLRVFLCHASEDKQHVRRVYDELKERGFAPWLDSEDLVGGQDWEAEIRKAVSSSDVVLVFLSTHAITKTGYVQKEIRMALDVAERHPDGQIFIIPLRLDRCLIPDRLGKWQTVDLFNEDGLDRLERSLLTRFVVGAVWSSSDDISATPDKDMANLIKIRAMLASASPPTTREVIGEFAQSVNRLKGEAVYSNALQVCMASRTVVLHLQELLQKPESRIYRLFEQVDKLFDSSVKALSRVRSKRAQCYAESVRNRAQLVKSLRMTLPRRRQG